jgi:NDP-sugar pyrophosphorylase family protein
MEGFPDEEFLVLNGDSFVDIPFDRLVAGHRSAGADATLAVRWTRDPGRFGSVEVGDGGRVTAFREKVSDGPAWINAGVYVLKRSVLAGLPLDEPSSLERDVFPGLAQRGGPGRLFTVGFDAWFMDIGVPADYEALDRDPSALRKALRRGLPC